MSYEYKKNLTDYHVHSTFSHDGSCDMEDIITDAIKLGLDEICFTDHVDYGIKFDWNHTVDTIPSENKNVDYESYFKTLDELKKKYIDKLIIKKGLECGVQLHTINKFDALYNKYPLDFIILSIHQINNVELITRDYLKGKSQKEYIEGYYRYLYYVISQYKNYSVLGHLDLINRYEVAKEYYPFEYLEDIIVKILKIVIEDGKGIELNTSSFRYNLKSLTPSIEILKLYYQLGGKIITIGSDCHKKGQIGEYIEKGQQILKEVGFKYFCTFENMKPIFHKIY